MEEIMKKILSLALIFVMLLALASCGNTSTMTMGTGGTAGTYYAFGGILGSQIKASA